MYAHTRDNVIAHSAPRVIVVYEYTRGCLVYPIDFLSVNLFNLSMQLLILNGTRAFTNNS